MRKASAFFLLMMLVLMGCLCAFAQETAPTLSIRDVSVEIGESIVSYPQLEGLQDESVQNAINNDLVTSAGIPSFLNSLSAAANTPQGLRVTYDAAILGDRVFSAIIRANGKIGTQRNGVQAYALCYDLQTGNHLSLSDFFGDVDSAVLWMEETAQSSLDEEMTEYSEFSGVSPLPCDNFFVNETGIVFAFPGEQWRSETACGELQFRWEELSDFLLAGEDTLPGMLGLIAPNQPDAQIITSVAESGTLPGIPLSIGQSMTEADELLTVSRTPDKYPGGRSFVFDAPCMRDILVLSDDLLSGWDQSHVQGIQMKRGGFGGLIVGKTHRQDWLSALGEPAETITISENMAYDYRISQGQYDIYACGSLFLRLYSDTEGVLTAIQLNE